MLLTHVRQYPRTGVDLPAHYAWAGKTHRARILTLGGGGLFLGVSQRFIPGSELAIQMRLSRLPRIVAVKGKVCYQLPSLGIGVEFTEIKPEDRQAVLRVVCHRMVENRGFPRARLAVQVGHEEGSFIGISRDISVGGMFIETGNPVSSDWSLKLRFNLEDGGPIVITTAEIRYAVEKLGIGVQFTGLLPTDQHRIDVYVAKRESPPVQPLQAMQA